MWGKVLVATFLALALGVILVAALGIEVVGRQAIADDPRSGEVATFEEVAAAHDALFGAHVYDDGLDWAAMSADPTVVRALGALYAQSGPVSGSLGATGPDGALAFRIGAYDALVVLGVVEQTVTRGRPLASVDDVHGVLDPGRGFGFSTAQVFVLDGSLTNLGDLRRTILSRGDPRVLGLLHDGTRSSPLPPRRAIREAELEAALAAAGTRLTEPPYVSIDEDRREIVLGAFYATERVRFEGHARSLGELPTVIAWIAHHARPGVRAAVLRAEADGFAIRHLPEDRALSTHTP
jgi:hypothetical protein